MKINKQILIILIVVIITIEAKEKLKVKQQKSFVEDLDIDDDEIFNQAQNKFKNAFQQNSKQALQDQNLQIFQYSRKTIQKLGLPIVLEEQLQLLINLHQKVFEAIDIYFQDLNIPYITFVGVGIIVLIFSYVPIYLIDTLMSFIGLKQSKKVWKKQDLKHNFVFNQVDLISQLNGISRDFQDNFKIVSEIKTKLQSCDSGQDQGKNQNQMEIIQFIQKQIDNVNQQINQAQAENQQQNVQSQKTFKLMLDESQSIKEKLEFISSDQDQKVAAQIKEIIDLHQKLKQVNFSQQNNKREESKSLKRSIILETETNLQTQQAEYVGGIEDGKGEDIEYYYDEEDDADLL